MASDTQEALHKIFTELSGGAGFIKMEATEDAAAPVAEAIVKSTTTGIANTLAAAIPAVTIEGKAPAPVAATTPDEVAEAPRASAEARTQTQSAMDFYQSLTSGALGTTVSAAATAARGNEGATATSVAKTVLSSGFGILPLVSALFGLFGGGDEEPPPLVKYALPPKLAFEAAETASGMTEVAYDQSGAPRAAERSVSSMGSPPQINVTVQAMDARSFLDRSGDIAAAVREAMLNLNSINDVITDL